MPLSEQDALARARALAEERGWPWLEPVEVSRERSLVVVGRERWVVTTHVGYRGASARIVMNADDGSIVSAGYLPR